MSPEPASDQPVLSELIDLFHPDSEAIGEVSERTSTQLPEPYRRLLAHNEHMTVTVEKFHDCPVSVEVLDRRFDEPYYSREIILRRISDDRVVQYGIVRLDVTCLDDEVCEAILSEKIPLGRVLIEHDVLREVQLSALWEFKAGTRLAELFSCPLGRSVYGRTAMIFFDSEPTIELLEIVAPESA